MNEKEFTALKEAIEKKEPVLVSGCLLGMMINYEEKSHLVTELRNLLLSGQAIAVCPEVLGAYQHRVILRRFKEGKRVKRWLRVRVKTSLKPLKKGLSGPLRRPRRRVPSLPFLKSQSPSCGLARVYDGSFTGTLTSGDGIAASLLKDNGITVITEEDFCACIK